VPTPTAPQLRRLVTAKYDKYPNKIQIENPQQKMKSNALKCPEVDIK
jgi:hypothetical protein